MNQNSFDSSKGKNNMDTEKTWESIRSNWVNGNKSDARNALMCQTKTKMLCVILEALISYYDNFDSRTKTYSGDLIDLIEILKYSRI